MVLLMILCSALAGIATSGLVLLAGQPLWLALCLYPPAGACGLLLAAAFGCATRSGEGK